MLNVTVNITRYGQCHGIQQYRTDLKEDVTKVLQSGKLHRNEYINHQSGFNMKNQDFPPRSESKNFNNRYGIVYKQKHVIMMHLI